MQERVRQKAFGKLKKQLADALRRGKKPPELLLVDEKAEESEELDLVELLELGRVEEEVDCDEG